ncbi:unnamed protein product, partial [Brenthis ino]
MALLPELDVRTVLNVVEENFQRVRLKAYAIRMIYIGEHVLPKEELINHFQATIYDVNSSYCETNVFGLLLVYDSYFVHVVEGSEDTVHRHLRFLFDRENKWIEEKLEEDKAMAEEEDLTVILGEEAVAKPETRMFKRLKMLILYHSIQTLIFDNWRALTARPPSLIGKLDVHGSMAEHMEQLRICLDKIKRVCELTKADQNVKSVWPLPNHFTPRLLYKLKVDDSFVEPLPVMPWELVKKEVEEEEKEERQSMSSSSD